MRVIQNELNKLHLKSTNLVNILQKNKEYSTETLNYWKILNFTQSKVEDKLLEILPHPLRIKRGLINGLGSIFKSISGNLDANDGERYDRLIHELQQNQRNIAVSVNKQNSLSLALINKFNTTIQQISSNEKIIETKLKQIENIVERQLYKENRSTLIKDLMIQLINMYELIISILQDIENSITFSKLQVMHPSIIKINDLYKELKNIESKLGKNELPLEITLENTLLYEKIIKVKSYISNSKITYILEIPITHPTQFEFYHLYSVPVLVESQFKVLVPRSKFLIKNQLYHAFLDEPCKEIYPNMHICQQTDLHENIEQNCELQLLNMQNTSNCNRIAIKISNIVIKNLDGTNKWIIVLPQQEKIKLTCKTQEEIQSLSSGTFLIEIPFDCTIITSRGKIINSEEGYKNYPQILFPDIDIQTKDDHTTKSNIQLKEFELDDLDSIRSNFINNNPSISFSDVASYPSYLTMLVYGLIIVVLVYLVLKKIYDKCFPKNEVRNSALEMNSVQLPS